MKKMKLELVNNNAHDEFKHKQPKKEDYSRLIKEFGIYELENNNSILYMDLGKAGENLIKAFQNVSYYSSRRTGGLKTNSSLLAYKPRAPLKGEFCSTASMSYNYPLEHDLFLETSRNLSLLYKKYLPEVFKKHMDEIEKERKIGQNKYKKLLKEYIIEGTPFTSGVVNKNNELKYHYDHGNIKDVCSAMVVLKNDVVGGYLSIPAYGVAFEMKNNSVLFFNGQNILHGVTSIYKTSIDAYRFSVVYYTLKDMWNCLTSEEELMESRKYYEKKDAK